MLPESNRGAVLKVAKIKIVGWANGLIFCPRGELSTITAWAPTSCPPYLANRVPITWLAEHATPVGKQDGLRGEGKVEKISLAEISNPPTFRESTRKTILQAASNVSRAIPNAL